VTKARTSKLVLCETEQLQDQVGCLMSFKNNVIDMCWQIICLMALFVIVFGHVHCLHMMLNG